MKRLIHLLVSAMIVLPVLWLGSVQPATACSCAEVANPAEALEQASAVFSGRVLSLECPSGLVHSSADPVTAVFEVDTVWKGPQQSRIVVTTALMDSSCGFEFRIGRSYLVYAYGAEDDLQTDRCTRTRLLMEAQEDLESLGDGWESDYIQEPPIAAD
ncbi:MAG: hypothetical protein SVM79_02855, partial [Chloroflexota bacterium]|nr:hypothetical protein [Chloroflexota bacterium]